MPSPRSPATLKTLTAELKRKHSEPTVNTCTLSISANISAQVYTKDGIFLCHTPIILPCPKNKEKYYLRAPDYYDAVIHVSASEKHRFLSPTWENNRFILDISYSADSFPKQKEGDETETWEKATKKEKNESKPDSDSPFSHIFSLLSDNTSAIAWPIIWTPFGASTFITPAAYFKYGKNQYFVEMVRKDKGIEPKIIETKQFILKNFNDLALDKSETVNALVRLTNIDPQSLTEIIKNNPSPDTAANEIGKLLVIKRQKLAEDLKDNTAIVERAVLGDIDPNFAMPDKNRPLSYAAANISDAQVIHQLIKNGANPLWTDSLGRTALCLAAQNSQIENAAALIALTSVTDGIECRNSKKQTLLDTAILNQEWDSAVTFLLLGVPSEHISRKKQLLAAVVRHAKTINETNYPAFENALKRLKKAGINLNAKDEYQETPMAKAAKAGNYLFVNALLKNGVPADDINAVKAPCRQLCCSTVLDTLDKKIRNKKETALEKEIRSFLWENGARNCNSEIQRQGKIHSLWQTHQYRKLGYYIFHDCHLPDTEYKNADGQTILMYAAKKEDEIIVQKLIEQGADVTAADNSGKTVLMYAEEGGNPVSLRLIKEELKKKDAL
ncbi:MAG: ankyrin repeat domain-containing protein [Alphaproteobacteria bacterium]|nr:ankyrin repeat domain-containing protein [Alphaproteobacteria bacterium]